MPGEAGHLACDLADATAAARALRQAAPDAVIHTQAMSDVDRCELEPREAERMNAQTVDHLCHALEASGVPILVLSTDYVFDGTKGRPYDEDDTPNPISAYGRSKLEGERLALQYSGAVVIRPSTLFGPGRNNFCDTVVERVRRGETVQAFIDQATSPTYTDDLAGALEAILRAMRGDARRRMPRIVHATNGGGCRRIEFVTRVLELLGYPASLVQPIRMEEQARPAKRPAYSVLTSRHLATIIGAQLRPWDEALHAYLRHRHWL